MINNQKKNKYGDIVVIISVVLIIALGLFLTKLFDKEKYTLNTKEIIVDNVLYRIPKKYNYEKDGDFLMLKEPNLDTMIIISMFEDDYDYYKNNLSIFKSELKKEELNPQNVNIKEYNDKEYITSEIIYESTNSIYAITKYDNNNVYGIIIINEDEDYYYDLLNDVSSILNNSNKI